MAERASRSDASSRSRPSPPCARASLEARGNSQSRTQINANSRLIGRVLEALARVRARSLSGQDSWTPASLGRPLGRLSAASSPRSDFTALTGHSRRADRLRANLGTLNPQTEVPHVCEASLSQFRGIPREQRVLHAAALRMREGRLGRRGQARLDGRLPRATSFRARRLGQELADGQEGHEAGRRTDEDGEALSTGRLLGRPSPGHPPCATSRHPSTTTCWP